MMKKHHSLFAALCLCFASSTSYAGEVVPNHIAHPLHSDEADSSGLMDRMGNSQPATKASPTLAPGGLSNKNVVSGFPSWSPNLGDIATYADNSVQQADIGSKVAGLDKSGNVTAPVNTQHMDANDFLRVGSFPGTNTYFGQESPSPLGSFFTRRTINTNDINLPATDGIPIERALMLGGQRSYAKAFEWIFGQPDSGNLGAAVDFVAMNGMSAGQGTGVSAGGFDTMLGYMNYDAAARATRTGSTPPKFVASASVQDPDGVSHAVTFTARGASFSPALPAYWGTMLHTGMNVATNELGVATGTIKQSIWQNNWDTDGYRRPFNTYFGTITGWKRNPDGTIPSVSVDGWVIFQQGNYNLGNDRNKVPGKDTLDGSKPALDTVFTQISSPAILFGVFTKAFPQYELCDLEPQKPGGDFNNPNGSVYSLVHECDHEVDLWNRDPTDYLNSIHGYTMVFDNSGGGKLTKDSYAFTVSGGGALPLGYHIRNLLEGSPGFQAMSNGSTTQTNIYTPYAVGANIGDTSVLQSWGNELAKGGINTSTLRLIQYRDAAPAANETNDAAQSKVSLHLQWRWDTTVNPQAEQGAVGAQIVYNPPGYEYGLGLGAGGSFQNPAYGEYISQGGSVWLPNGATVMNGNGFGMIPFSGDTKGHPFIAASAPDTIDAKTSAGGYASINSYGVTVMNGQGVGLVPMSGDKGGHPFITASSSNAMDVKATAGGYSQLNAYSLSANGGDVLVNTGQGVGFVPTTGDGAGHPYFHAADNYHLLLSDTAGGDGGLQVGAFTANAAAVFKGTVYIPNQATIDGNINTGGNITLSTPGNYMKFSSPTPDSNNQDQRIYADPDGSLYLTNIGKEASHYMVTKVDGLKATMLKGSGNAFACLDANGLLFRSDTPCK
ncbi:autotransporter outer membrane beta-barrel domain-containing protein [Swingsia samuiensis]|uniref:Uncharacterized protein n=1 Tax=Swingsia samuiensis TaxID=1293412 RepID=A0A4Y6UIE9_9PROT|nr:hypothetical protein [Swingsia samuiensis]QDH17389.1 hypothetical protein E3D00_07300 [Swingsia samuiensis]